MHVSKWGNSLAIRLPAAVVETLDLKEGDEIEIVVAGARSFETRLAIRYGHGHSASSPEESGSVICPMPHLSTASTTRSQASWAPARDDAGASIAKHIVGVCRADFKFDRLEQSKSRGRHRRALAGGA